MEPNLTPKEGHESQKNPEPQDSPEHLFVKDQLAGISFLNPKTQEKTSLRDSLGKLFPRYEAIVLAQFDLLKATEGPPTKYKEDAKKRAEQIYRDWKTEQRREAEFSDKPFRKNWWDEDDIASMQSRERGRPRTGIRG
ncbi:MAG: hypothetical protein A2958_02060 [Candidatus Levybacteria bacterium RIFCSPLOWO2_01_FULL_38_13]|nr:MAG: hypothetical protein A2629_02815 [Candidatus Levybacteria bacterium RIFCSPHIGHO2_01_FULL_41_15]OGH35736.1 MAG: hypothetical protein A2958_02060 [Candidatus Levybacteria bacterium RIFCSPLOWO2_01_FULL_38_13]